VFHWTALMNYAVQ